MAGLTTLIQKMQRALYEEAALKGAMLAGPYFQTELKDFTTAVLAARTEFDIALPIFKRNHDTLKKIAPLLRAMEKFAAKPEL